MAWPTPLNGSVTGIAAQGADATHIRWGTESLWGIFIVTRATQKPLNENIKLQQGRGLTSTRVQIVDGNVWELTVRDDDRMTVPAIGTVATVVDIAGLLGTAGASVTGRIIENGYDVSPKSPGERTITIEKLTLVD